MDKIIWTDSAIQDLNDIGDYNANDSEKYAEITVNYLFDSDDIPELQLLAGKIVPEFENESIIELIRGNYRIAYQIINKDRIDILTVHNCARLIENTYDFRDEDEK